MMSIVTSLTGKLLNSLTQQALTEIKNANLSTEIVLIFSTDRTCDDRSSKKSENRLYLQAFRLLCVEPRRKRKSQGTQTKSWIFEVKVVSALFLRDSLREILYTVEEDTLPQV